jgi:lipopolysaccharide/colanic/teichoic acid biosynthesis glycosyltransferase
MAAFLIVLIDMLMVVATVQGVGWSFHEFVFPDSVFGFAGATVNSVSILLLVVFGNYSVSLYDRDILVTRAGLTSRVIVATSGAILGALLIQYFVWYVPNGRVVIISQALAIGSITLLGRWVISSFYRRSPKRAVAVYGTRSVCAELDRILNNQAYCPFEVRSLVAIVPSSCDTASTADEYVELPAYIESFDELRDLAPEGAVAPEFLVMGHQGTLGSKVLGSMTYLQYRGVRVCSAAALVSDLAGFIPIDLASVDWVVGALDRVHGRGSVPFKRLIDVSVSLLGLGILGVLSPVLFVMAKIRSPGPLLFTQPRVGLGGEPFTMYKLRTMTVVADTEGKWASEETARISVGGRWLRQLRLDELPQFWNVLRGEMSVVGPRPEQPVIVEALKSSIELLHYRNMIKPGITGWAQVKQGYVDTADASVKKLMYDLYYVQNFGIMLDLEIMVKTAFIMLARIGAR